MAKYRKKPVVVDAVQIASIEPGIGLCIKRETFPHWLEEALHQRDVREHGDRVLIDTLEGVMTAMPGDYIIRGIKGEIYPCKPDIFKATYELVQDSNSITHWMPIPHPPAINDTRKG